MIGLPTKIQQATTEVRTSVQTKVDAAQSAVQTTLITTQQTVKGVQDYEPLALKDMHLCCQRYAPLTGKDMHHWFSMICTFSSLQAAR